MVRIKTYGDTPRRLLERQGAHVKPQPPPESEEQNQRNKKGRKEMKDMRNLGTLERFAEETDRLRKENKALRSRIKKLDKAVKPFVAKELLDQMDESDGFVELQLCGLYLGPIKGLKVADFRILASA
jgi:regulator of replication initiation timing